MNSQYVLLAYVSSKQNIGVLPNGKALGLGACLAVTAEILQKSRKAFNGADFQHFTKTQNGVEFAFDHSLSHFHAKRPKIE